MAQRRGSILMLLLSSACPSCAFLVPPPAARAHTRHAQVRHVAVPSVRMEATTIMDMPMPKELADWGALPATAHSDRSASGAPSHVSCVLLPPLSHPAPPTAGMDEELWGKINRNSRKSLLGGVKKGFSSESLTSCGEAARREQVRVRVRRGRGRGRGR